MKNLFSVSAVILAASAVVVPATVSAQSQRGPLPGGAVLDFRAARQCHPP